MEFWIKMLRNMVLKMLWLIVHLIYHLAREFLDWMRWFYKSLSRKFRSCLCISKYDNYHTQLINLARTSKLLRKGKEKRPGHLAIGLVNNKGLGPFAAFWRNVRLLRQGQSSPSGVRNEEIDLQQLSKVVCWAWIADIPLITLYDYKGFIKSRYHKLRSHIEEEILHHLTLLGKQSSPPVIKFHNYPKTNGFKNGMNGLNGGTDRLDICLMSNEDGKQGLVEATKNIYHQRDKEANGSKIDNSLVESKVNLVVDLESLGAMKMKTDPDLLVILGSVQSTTGFLPWHIRLTEIYWLPPLGRIECGDLSKALLKYADCHQRFGT